MEELYLQPPGTASAESPRNRLLQRGAAALSDAELLALLLQMGVGNSHALMLARDLLSGFSGLSGVMQAGQSVLLAYPGVGPARYARLAAAAELARRQTLQEVRANGDVLSSPVHTRRFLSHHLGSHPREVFTCLFMDTQHRVLRYEDLFFGTLDGAAVYPREVAVRALQYGAAAVIFAHNHPSGTPQPSAADRRITERLVSALALLDIRVLDHIIVGTGQPYSFLEQGLL